MLRLDDPEFASDAVARALSGSELVVGSVLDVDDRERELAEVCQCFSVTGP
jgi:hypothetical protein